MEHLTKAIEEIEEQISTLQGVVDTLKGLGSSQSKPQAKKAVKKAPRFSPEALKRIGAATKKRWAARKKALKQAAKAAGGA